MKLITSKTCLVCGTKFGRTIGFNDYTWGAKSCCTPECTHELGVVRRLYNKGLLKHVVELVCNEI